MLINMLILDSYYKDTFDKIYFVCPTFFLDPKYSVLDLPASQIMTTFDEKKIETIMKNKREDEQILIIFDDCLAEKGFKKNESNNALNLIATTGRHIGVSIILAVQKTSGSSTTVRTQVDGVYIWRPRSLSEYESLYQDNCVAGLSKKEFVSLVNYATEEDYSYLFLNNQTKEVYRNTNKINIPKRNAQLEI